MKLPKIKLKLSHKLLLIFIGIFVVLMYVVGYVPVIGRYIAEFEIEFYTDYEVEFEKFDAYNFKYRFIATSHDDAELVYKLSTGTLANYTFKGEILWKEVSDTYLNEVVPLFEDTMLCPSDLIVHYHTRIRWPQKETYDLQSYQPFINTEIISEEESEKMPQIIAETIFAGMGEEYDFNGFVIIGYNDNNGTYELDTENIGSLFHSYENDTTRTSDFNVDEWLDSRGVTITDDGDLIYSQNAPYHLVSPKKYRNEAS